MLVNMVNNTTEQYYSLPESWCQLTSQCVSGWVKLNPFNCVKSVVRYVGKVDLKFYRFSTWFTTVSRQCRYSAGRRRASTSIKFSRGLTCLHAHLYVKCRQVNNCMYTSNFGPSHHQSGLPKPKCDRLKWCKAGFWSAWPVAHCLKDTQALLCFLDTLTGDNWVPHCVMARVKTACLWSSCMSTVCNVGPWPIIY